MSDTVDTVRTSGTCSVFGSQIEWVGAPHYLHVTELKVEAREAGSSPETMQCVIRADEAEYT